MPKLLEEALGFSNLHLAWQDVEKNRGCAGVDDINTWVWQRNWEERLLNLAASVRANTYHPKKLRSRKIPKANRTEFRTLRIPTVTDRVLQRAVLEILYPVYEAKFKSCSFGYRPGMGLKQAVDEILFLREAGCSYVLDADIDEFFNQVDASLLIGFLYSDLPDTSLLPLLKSWILNGLWDTDQNRGIPMGSPLSPLLANVYLHRLDCAVLERGWHMVRYADDFVVFTRSKQEAELTYPAVSAILETLRLKFEPSKTRLTTFEQGFSFLGVHFDAKEYRYTYKEKEVRVKGRRADPLFGQYGPDYC